MDNVKPGRNSFFELGEFRFEMGSSFMRGLGWVLFLLSGAGVAVASEVHTNPLNRDPQVREAFEHFYNLDYPGAVERFGRFHAEHPGDPEATVLLLEAELFQELYRQDLLDTTFYANDGFLTASPTRPFARPIGGSARIRMTWMRWQRVPGQGL
jgi:hypothetical protein